MRKLLDSRKLQAVIFWILILLVVIGIYPGTGGEGGQRDLVGLDQKTDWWNFGTAALYGLWPNGLLPWAYTLTIIQLIIYAVGVYLIAKSFNPGANQKILTGISLIGALFVCQLWRDATLFSIQTLSIGLVAQLKTLKHRTDFIIVLLALSLNLISGLFKPIFAPIGVLIFFLVVATKTRNSGYKKLIAVCVLLFALVPFAADRQLNKTFDLVKSYPDQQVYIYDLAKLYCWGFSPDTVLESKKALKPLLTSPDNFEAVCASLSPTGWDALRVRIPEVSSSPALQPLVSAQGIELHNLRESWIQIIAAKPIDWLMTKTSDGAQVLFMANAFHMPGLYAEDSESWILKSGNWLIQALLLPILILDKIRFFSIGFTLFIGALLVYFNRTRSNFSLPKERALFAFLTLNVITLGFATLAFIANNGRYVLPYMFLSYFYLLIALEKSRTN
jgi:hypothetical protein